MPNSAVKFLTYEHMSRRAARRAPPAGGDITPRAAHTLSAAAARRFILEHRKSNSPDAEMTPLLRLGAGAVAGIIAMSATYPLDMVRGRLTVQADGSPSACVPARRVVAPRGASRLRLTRCGSGAGTGASCTRRAR